MLRSTSPASSITEQEITQLPGIATSPIPTTLWVGGHCRLKGRSGKPLLRGRKTKVGKSVLFVVKDSKNLSKASSSLLGVDVVSAKSLSVLDLAPGATPVRLTVFSKGAIEEISKIKSPHLEIMVTNK